MNRISYFTLPSAYSTCRETSRNELKVSWVRREIDSAKTTTRSPGRVPPAREEEQTGALTKGALQLLMNEARLSHLPFWGPSEGFFLIN